MNGASEKTMIVAVSPEGVIGVDGQIPWRHPGDLKRFKRVTMGGTLIMGRNTWESIGQRPLPGRRNIVITRRALDGVEHFASLPDALATTTGPVWFIGGAKIYEEAMRWADAIDVTYVPDHVVAPNAVYFPQIDPFFWEEGPLVEHEDEPGLTRRLYQRRRFA
ncbi:dihydrofolate reductase [Myxococcota bacterium]|nr:dihydrofolate reductase [Myxococcota bacterium]